MKMVQTVAVTIVTMIGLAGAAVGFMTPGHGRMGHGMMMPMGPHRMAQGMGPGMHGGAMNATQVTEDQAKGSPRSIWTSS